MNEIRHNWELVDRRHNKS